MVPLSGCFGVAKELPRYEEYLLYFPTMHRLQQLASFHRKEYTAERGTALHISDYVDDAAYLLVTPSLKGCFLK